MSQISGALIQLVAYGAQDASFRTDQVARVAVENVQVSFENNELNIPRNGDTIIPKYINSNHPIEFLEFTIGGSEIIKFPLKFCNILSNFGDTHETFIYKIPWELLNFKPLPLVALQFHQVGFKIISNEQCDAKLFYCINYLDDVERRRLATSFHEFIIKQFQEQASEINSNENIIQLNLNGLIKGIFIDNVNIDEINSFQLLLSNHIRINYDKVMIELFTQKISENCIYISFDNKDFNDLSVNSAINFDRFGLSDELEYDLSGVDIPTAIEEFVAILEIEDKEKIIDHTLDLYKRSK